VELDDFKERWLSQERKIEEILRINQRLQLRVQLRGPRAWMRWFRFGALLEILLGLLWLSWTGSFIYRVFGEPRFLLPAVALQLWLIGTTGTAIARYARAELIDYGAPVLEIQRQVGALRLFTLRSLRLVFVFGVPVWGVAVPILALRAVLGIDLYAIVGARNLILYTLGNLALGLAVVRLCTLWALWAERPGSPTWLRGSARVFSGYSLNAAADQLQKIQDFEREP
jgi:hypothetical protein